MLVIFVTFRNFTSSPGGHQVCVSLPVFIKEPEAIYYCRDINKVHRVLTNKRKAEK